MDRFCCVAIILSITLASIGCRSAEPPVPPKQIERPPPTLSPPIRISKYDTLVKVHAGRYGLDWLLVSAQIWAESSFRPEAVSPVGALGLMQIMPGTAQWLGVDPSSLLDPSTNIQLGCLYDAKLYAMWKEEEGTHRIAFMLASYNAGPGRVLKAQKEAQVKNHWNDAGGIKNHLPKETQHYVPKIFKKWDEYKRRVI